MEAGEVLPAVQPRGVVVLLFCFGGWFGVVVVCTWDVYMCVSLWIF